jgi:hypothetical protein
VSADRLLDGPQHHGRVPVRRSDARIALVSGRSVLARLRLGRSIQPPKHLDQPCQHRHHDDDQTDDQQLHRHHHHIFLYLTRDSPYSPPVARSGQPPEPDAESSCRSARRHPPAAGGSGFTFGV